jgi:hypothetical protein
MKICTLAFFIGLLAGVPSTAGILYGVDDNAQQSGGSSKLYIINQATGLASEVGALGQQALAGGLAHDTSHETLFVSDLFVVTGPTFTNNLASIDLVTGAATLIGVHTGAAGNAVSGLAYDSADDILYGAGNSIQLVRVDRATGAMTLVGAFGARIDGLAYDRGSGTLYGVNATNLYTINQNTGAATLVGPHGIATTALSIGLESESDSGRLFVTDTVTDSLFELDPATGAATLIGALGANIGALASVPDAAPPTPTTGVITSSQYPNFRFWVRISDIRTGTAVADCLPETVCIAGAIPTRAEVFLRIVGPKPNGRLWPNIVKFNTTKTEVWIQQITTGVTKYYLLPALTPDSEVLPGLVDKTGFLP